jgi:hypothetical protein
MRRIVIILICLVTGFGLFAKDFELADREFGAYIDLRMGLWWDSQDETYRQQTDPYATSSRLSYKNQLYNNCRVGFKLENDEDIDGQVEIGFGDKDLYMRLLWGEFDFDWVRVMVGKNYSGFGELSNQGVSILDAEDAIGWGPACDGRHAQVRFTFDDDIAIALMEPNEVDPDSLGNTQNLMPKFNVFRPFFIQGLNLSLTPSLGANYSQFDNDVSEAGTWSYVGALTADGRIGRVLYQAQIWGGQNPTDYGIEMPVVAGATMNALQTDFEDTKAIGAFGQFSVPIHGNEFSAGAGYYSVDRHNATDKDTGMTLFANFTIEVDEWFNIIPEAGVFDYMNDETGKDEGSITYFGTKLQLRF